jgi:hypothetical protein
MDVLFFNLTYVKGHKYYDEKMIDNLLKVSNLYVLCPRNWYRRESSGATYIFNGKELSLSKATTLGILKNGISNCKAAVRYIKTNHIDVIIIGKHDYFSMSVARFLLPGTIPIFLIQHNEIDQLNVMGIKGKIKRFCFNIFKDRVIHCVLEEFVKDYLITEEGISDNRVCCWPHPIERDFIILNKERKYDCVGISTSNNEHIIMDIINTETKTENLKKHNRHIVLRSKTESFDNGHLKVFHGWIDDQEYENYINNAKSVLIAFKEGYCNRVSASIFDAFSRHIPVLCTDMPLARFYNKKYGNICMIIDKDFVHTLNFIGKTSSDDESKFYEFYKDHNDETIQNIIKNDFQRLIRNII